MASLKENLKFNESWVNERLLDEAIEFIKLNFGPEEIYDVQTLHEWADRYYERNEE